MGVSVATRLLHAGVLLAFLVLALYFPYWWFGVVPFAVENDISQATIDELLEGTDLPDYYAEALPAASEAELAAEREAFTWCRFCHTLAQGEENKVGPNLYRIYGAPAAVNPTFPYSEAFIEARENGLIWTPENMAAFVADPAGFLPHNRMRYPPMIGYEKSAERDRLILNYMLRMTR